MIYEKLEGITFDIDKLKAHLTERVFPFFPRVMQGPRFGGWSVLSRTGSYTDGWQQGHNCWKNVDGKMVFDPVVAGAIGWVRNGEHRNPTEICTGYLKEVIETIRALKFYPKRARISFILPGGRTDWHVDSMPDIYSVRLHIPIITDPHCLFRTEDEGAVHMPADGSGYLVRVNRLHRAVNLGDQVRYHLMMQVWDMGHFSKYHQYTPTPEERENYRRRKNLQQTHGTDP